MVNELVVVAVRVTCGECGGATKHRFISIIRSPVSSKVPFKVLMSLTMNNQLMRNGVMSKRVLNVARVFTGIGTIHFLDEQRSLGQLSQSVARLENGATYFPCNFRCGYTDSQAG